MEILVYPPGGNSGFRNEFYWIAVNIKPFHYTVVYLQWSLKNSSTVNQRKLMHSADLVSSSLQTQFEYSRQQRREKKCITHSCCPYFHCHEWVVLPLPVNQGQQGMFVHHSSRKKKEIWYTGNRMRLIPSDARHLWDQLAHKRSQSAPQLRSHDKAP